MAPPPKHDAPQVKVETDGFRPVSNSSAKGKHSFQSPLMPNGARRAEPLDLNKVERRGTPTAAKPAPKTSRIHDIPEAPTFRPSAEQFQDPLRYISSIASEAQHYGIAKIIPPDSWNPPFAIDTSRFTFRTRRQELNSIEGGTRANLDYLDHLAKFHRQNGTNLTRFPSVDKKPLDLYKLKKAVEARGGFEVVCRSKKWAEIGRDLGYSGKIMSSLSTSLKNSYQRWLEPYEQYLRVAKPGVQQKIELENGGPYVPSPGASPVKTPTSQHNGSPTTSTEHDSAIRASAALNASLASNVKPEPPKVANSGGFTPVNPGGFTAVNRPASGFTPVNGPNGQHTTRNASPAPIAATPPRSGTAFKPINSAEAPQAGLKRQHSQTAESPRNGDGENGARQKRQKRDAPPIIAGSSMHPTRVGPTKPPTLRDRTAPKPGELCDTCAQPETTSPALVCESCEGVYHVSCLEPQTSSKSTREWNCPRCLVGTGEFGFEQGELYTLKAFHEKAQHFKESYFANKLKSSVSENEVEREFWRLVEEITETVEVEYGADIHSTTHGSGFPTVEKQPRDPYSSDPWNLNLLPLAGESLFKYIKSDISGMTDPWLYVGMTFSTFCWHNEDHYTYSANYQHLGDTKTWYGIPGEDADKFEAAMREAVPELFECQPDLLFQLVTLMPPQKLRKAGLRVYALDQRAGEFVITFPQAYHAGFNHGFNFNEAVNFASPDWEPFGALSIERLQTFRRQPAFSHDELLLTAAARDNSLKTAEWLAPGLERMLEKEKRARAHFLDDPGPADEGALDDVYRGPRYADMPIIDKEELDEEATLCCVCKCHAFLSRYVCDNSQKTMCLWHAGTHACCDEADADRYSNASRHHSLYYHLDADVLQATVRKVIDRASLPKAWVEKFEHLLANEPRPSLKSLRTLLHEGERIPHDFVQLPDLKRFVDRCTEWVEEAQTYITRKPGRRKSDKPGRKSFARGTEQDESKDPRSLGNIRRLLAEANDLSFSCPEIDTLREREESIMDFQKQTRDMLSGPLQPVHQYEQLNEIGKTFDVDIPEIDLLDRAIERLRWREEAQERRQHPQTLSSLSSFMKTGDRLGLPEDDPDLLYLSELKKQGSVWQAKAKEVLADQDANFDTLESLSRQGKLLPVDQETLDQLDGIIKQQREAREKIISLYEQSKDPELRERPMYKDVKALLEGLEHLANKPAGTNELERELRKHEDWMRRGKKLFGKTNAPLHILHQHMIIVKERNDGCFELRDKPRMPVEPSSRQVTPDPEAEAEGGEKPFPDVFCICRKPEAGMMIECELCHEWYHGRCLKIARGKVKEDDKYTCPICDWRLKIPRDAARPKLEELQAWHSEIEDLPFQPEEEQTLTDTIETAENFRDYVRPYLNPLTVTPEEVSTLRFYLRKVEGADLLLTEETNFLRQEMHKWAPVAPIAPPIIEASGSTRKARPTKVQKIMARLGISNPDDLPEEHKPKQTAKRRSLGMTLTPKESLKPIRKSSSSANQRTSTGGGPRSAGPRSAAPTSAAPSSAGPTSARPYDMGSDSRFSNAPAMYPGSPYDDPPSAHSRLDQNVHSTHSTRPPSALDQAEGDGNLDPELMGMDDGPPMFRETMSPSHKDEHPPETSFFADMVYHDTDMSNTGPNEADVEAEDERMDEFVNSQ